MRLVLDSSAVITACLSPVARADLETHELIAPPILWSEVHSAMRGVVWRGEIKGSEMLAALDVFWELPIARRAPRRMYELAMELAERLGWVKTYDAEFLALAEIEGGLVLTADGRFRRGAERTGLVIGPSEL